MKGLSILGLVLAIAAIVALTGWRPSGARPVASTQLMTVGKLILVAAAAACALFLLQA